MNSAASFRAAILETIFIAIFIALGVNVISNGSVFGFGQVLSISIGFCAILVGLLFIFFRSVPNINRKYTFSGVLLFDGKDREGITIPRYQFSYEFNKSLHGLFVENKVYRENWKLERPNDVHFYKSTEEFKNIPFFNRLVVENIEYVVLKSLSMHLSGYFQNAAVANDKEIVTLSRGDIPSVLLTNKFLELFSRPMEEREAFQIAKTSDKEIIQIARVSGDQEIVVSAISKDGAVFERFELILPQRTKIYRRSDNSICIKNRKFELVVRPIFHGFRGNTPQHFEYMYLNKNFRSLEVYQVDLELEVKFSYTTLLSGRGWKYLRWIESFTDKLEDNISFDAFIKQIGWETAVTTEIIRINALRRKGHSRSVETTEGGNKSSSPSADQNLT